MFKDNKYKKVFNIESLGNIYFVLVWNDRFVMDKIRVY